ncbi:thioredoxin [Myxosarcina sp. GI1]|uniref:thioredoxin n=1 Tax=Myxosarcina sp. GI1 TaxID=1541065 RepID=UPI000559BD9D|nr:thioredoxin [Myxosarcina sp. GI1]
MSNTNVPITLNAENFATEVLNSSIPVVVDFWAPWCGPCRVINPILTDLAEKYAGVVKIGKLNIDDFPQIASQYRIDAIPTLLFFARGQVKERVAGLLPKPLLFEKVETLVAPSDKAA